MDTTLPVTDFWRSPDVVAQIQDRTRAVPKDGSPEPWMILQGSILRSIFDDDTRRCHGDLIFFARLIRQFRSHLDTHFGPACWKEAKEAWKGDNRRTVLLKFLKEISLADRKDSLVALIDLRSKGLTYLLPSGRTMQCTPFDHGIEELVSLMGEMEKFLSENSVNGLPVEVGKQRPASLNHQVVIIKLVGGKSLEVRFGRRRCQLKRQLCTFLLLLKSQPSGIPDKDLWEHLYPGEDYVPDAGGPPGALRSLKSRTERKLQESLGMPPNGTKWIVRIPDLGYCLFRSDGNLVWSLAKETEAKMRLVLFSSRRLDGGADTD